MTAEIRILCLLVFAFCLTREGLPGIAAATGLLLLISLWMAGNPWHGIGKLFGRVRWLLLSLLIIYGWFTPGRDLVSALGVFSPTADGLQAGAMRIAALALMVAAVHLLLRSTGRDYLMTALYRLLAPAAALGFPRERLAVRMVLVLEVLPRVQTLVREALATVGPAQSVRERSAETVRGVFGAVLLEAETRAIGRVDVPEAAPTPWYQWFYPVLVAGLFVLA